MNNKKGRKKGRKKERKKERGEERTATNRLPILSTSAAP